MFCRIVIFLTLILVAVSAFADNGRGRHKKVYAVPAPKTITVDGALDDWDQSGQIEMYVVEQTAAKQSVKFALMYDAHSLYIGGTVRDSSPMLNRHDPLVDPDKAWDGDSCQFRMVLDASQGYPVNKEFTTKDPDDQMVHMILWYYTDKQEPALQLYYGMNFALPRAGYKNGVVPTEKYEAAYRKAPDGLGYTFEYKIPWVVLEARTPPQGGDIVAGTVQYNWGAEDGLRGKGQDAWSYDVMGTSGFPFLSSSCWGKIDFSATGNLTPELTSGTGTIAKPLPLDFNYSLPADGDTSLQLFDASRTVVRTLLAASPRKAGTNGEKWDGLDDTGKPIPPGRYTWKGLYHQPLKTKFILSAHNSGRPPYKLDNGTGGWGGDHGTPTATAVAGDKMLLTWNVSESGWGTICTDLTGKKLWGIKHNATDITSDGKRFFITGDFGYQGQNSVRVFDLDGGRPLNWGNGNVELAPPSGGDQATDIARAVTYGRGKIYVSWTDRDAVGVYDAVSGKLLDCWPVKKPGRLAVKINGELLVITNGVVATLGKTGARPYIGSHIDAPSALTVGRDGTIYVANSGKLQNISVFDGKGNFVRAIGKAGGRPRIGRYERNGMLDPGGISLDPKNRLWVAETLDSPKRISVWDGATGKFVNEFFGGSAYFAWAYMDPEHPDELYCHNVLWKVDLVKGTCVPQSTIWRPTGPNMIMQVNPDGYAGHFRVMTAKNGKQFGFGMVDYSPTLFIRQGDVFKPFAGAIRLSRGSRYGGDPLYPVMNDASRYPNGAYLWQDLNDDQTVQESEIIQQSEDRTERTLNWLDKDLNVWCDFGYKYSPVKFLSDGRPVYDFSKKQPIPFHGINSNGTSLWLDDQDDTVYTLAPGSEIGLGRYKPDGTEIWGYRGITPWANALNLSIVTPGKLFGLTMPLGIAGDFTGAASYFGPYHIFTRDGLYVGMVMRDLRTGGLGADITATEVVSGQLVKPKGMDRYFLLAGDQDGRVTEILGLNTVKRLTGGEFLLTAADAAKVAQAETDYQKLQSRKQKLEIVRSEAALPSADGVAVTLDSKRHFVVKAAYDKTNLYLDYEVEGSDLVNGYPDPNLLFKGGNAIDLQISTQAAMGQHFATPIPGDVRILVTRQTAGTGGPLRPMAVIYRPKVDGFTGKPILLTSPQGSSSFDEISVWKDFQMQYTATASGFHARVALPLKDLKLRLTPGKKIRMDVGYLFGNETGTQVAARAYWSNRSFSSGITNDVPSESRLEPAEWGTALVE